MSEPKALIDWRLLMAALGLLGMMEVGNAWITQRALDSIQSAVIAQNSAQDARLNKMAGTLLDLLNEHARLKAQSEVERILRICAERPEVCED